MIILRKQKYEELPWTQENIDKYKSSDNILKHARFIPGKTTGKFLVSPVNDELVGYIACKDDTIIALEVSPKYRGKGIVTDLINSSGATKLSVQKNNKNAIRLYEKLGFKVTSENPRVYFMEQRLVNKKLIDKKKDKE